MSLLACFCLGRLFSSRAAAMPQTANFCCLHPTFPRLIAVVSKPSFHPPIGQFAAVSHYRVTNWRTVWGRWGAPCAVRSAMVGTSHPNAAAQVWKNGPLYLPMPQGCRLSHKKDPLGEDSVACFGFVLRLCRIYIPNFLLRNEKAPLRL